MTVLLAASLVPPLFLLWKVYQSDEIEKEPTGLLLTVFLFGMISTLPAGILESIGEHVAGIATYFAEDFLPYGTSTRFFNFIFYFFVVGWAEEFVKYKAMKMATWRHPAFNYVFDGVVYAVTASLGFAALENVLYVLDADMAVGGLATAGMRAWTAIPLHCITGIFMGHYYGIARAADLWGDGRARDRMLRRSVLVPMLIHGAYDFIATDESPVLMAAFFVYILVLDVVAFRALRRYARNDVGLF